VDLRETSADEDFVRNWDEERRYLIDRNNRIAAETAAMRLGIRKGKLEGMEEGVKKGRLEGKLETALGMLRDNVPLPIITKCTGLTEREILGLAEK
jgi:predicted transposase/invertase (TIGR01784 family)